MPDNTRFNNCAHPSNKTLLATSAGARQWRPTVKLQMNLVWGKISLPIKNRQEPPKWISNHDKRRLVHWRFVEKKIDKSLEFLHLVCKIYEWNRAEHYNTYLVIKLFHAQCKLSSININCRHYKILHCKLKRLHLQWILLLFLHFEVRKIPNL